MCFKFIEKDLSRYQIEYPLTRYKYNNSLTGDKPLEISYLTVDLVNSDTASFVFLEPFSGVPNVILGLVTVTDDIGNVNVYTESVSKTGGVLRSSAPITAKVAVQAMYTE